MKQSIMRSLIGSLLIFFCSIALAGQMSFKITKGPVDSLSGYTAIGSVSANSVYTGNQADPNAVSDAKRASRSVDKTQSAQQETRATWVSLRGTIRNNDNPGQLVCAMVLANGQYMFSCNPRGAYDLTLPLDSNGQIVLQVFAAGHMPFLHKLPFNQGSYDVTLEIAEDCSGPHCGDGVCGTGEDYINCPADCSVPPPITHDITIDMVDMCVDGWDIQYKYYDFFNNWVWPSSTTHWVTPGYNLLDTHTLNCQHGAEVCFGGRSDDLYWGVDVDGSESCTNCCLPCEDEKWTVELSCN